MASPNTSANPPLLRRSAIALEHALHSLWRPWTRLLGWRAPRSIVAYRSYGTQSEAWVRGRVLGNRAEARALTTDSCIETLKHTWNRWMTYEVPDAQVKVHFEGQEQLVTADKDGFFEARFERQGRAPDQTTWLEAQSTTHGPDGAVHATHEVLIPGANAERLLISDIDDTVIHTGATKFFTITRLTFFTNVHRRRVFDDVAPLYAQLATAGGQPEANPIFYVSSSAWNLYGLIERILTLGLVPRGPLMFQQLGLANNRFVREPGHRHKLMKVESLLATYPELPVLLIGDTGQHDARLYADAVRRNPGRIQEVHLREVEADQGTPHDLMIREALDEMRAAGVLATRSRNLRDAIGGQDRPLPPNDSP